MKYNVLVNGERFEVELRDLTRAAARFELDGRCYEVSLEETVPLLAANRSPSPARSVAQRQTPNSGNPNHVCSPIPGVVLEVLAREGAAVASGDLVARIEAMKMENNIFAHRAGTVVKVFVNSGAEVGDGEPLLEIS